MMLRKCYHRALGGFLEEKSSGHFHATQIAGAPSAHMRPLLMGSH